MRRMSASVYIGQAAERTANNFSLGDYFIDESTGEYFLYAAPGNWIRLTPDPLVVNNLTATTANVATGVVDDLTATTANVTTGTVSNLTISNTGTLKDKSLVTYGNGGGVVLGDVALYLPFNYLGNNQVNLNGHLGQTPSTETGSIVGVDDDGLFGYGAVSTTRGFTNYNTNPVMDGGTTGYSTASLSTISVMSGEGKFEADALKVLSGGGQSFAQIAHTHTIGTIATDYTTSAFVKNYNLLGGETIQMLYYWIGGANANAADPAGWVTVGTLDASGWQRISHSAQPDYTDRTGFNVYVKIIHSLGDGHGFLTDGWQITKTAYQLPFRYYGMNGVTGSSGSNSVVAGTLLKYINPLNPYKGTIGGWVKVDDNVTAYGLMQTLWSLGATNGEFDAFLYHGGGAIYFRQNSVIYSFTAPPAGTWFHIAATWDYSASEIKYFLNGVQVGSTVSYTTLLDFGTNAGILCSAALSSDYSTNGYGAEWFLDTEPLDADLIRAIYNSNVPVSIPVSTNELSSSYGNGKLTINREGIQFNGNSGGIVHLLDTPVTHSNWDGSTSHSNGNYTLSVNDFGITDIDLTKTRGLLLYVTHALPAPTGIVQFMDSSFANDYWAMVEHSLAGATLFFGNAMIPNDAGSFYVKTSATGSYKIQLVGYII